MRKNRKLYVSLLVIVCLLCLGIGYAALSGELIIGGTIATGSADDLGNLQVYLVDAKDETVDPNVQCNPTLTGAGVAIDRVADYEEGYATGNIQITQFVSTTAAYAKFVVVNCESSTNDVVVGYDAVITYDGEAVADISEYFYIQGYFDENFSNALDVSKFADDSLQTVDLSSSLACSFFVKVGMKKVPPVEITGIKITITLTYNAK